MDDTFLDRLRAAWPSHRARVQGAALASLTLGLAPFYPHAHVYKQLVNLATGRLTTWIDAFDLAMHGAPWVALAAATGAWVATSARTAAPVEAAGDAGGADVSRS